MFFLFPYTSSINSDTEEEKQTVFVSTRAFFLATYTEYKISKQMVCFSTFYLVQRIHWTGQDNSFVIDEYINQRWISFFRCRDENSCTQWQHWWDMTISMFDVNQLADWDEIRSKQGWSDCCLPLREFFFLFYVGQARNGTYRYEQ